MNNINIYNIYQNICSPKDKYSTISQSLSNGNTRIIIFKNDVSASCGSFEINKNGEIEVQEYDKQKYNRNLK